MRTRKPEYLAFRLRTRDKQTAARACELADLSVSELARGA